jgi:hypothetical protein
VDCDRAATEELIERYLRGNVSEEERTEFEEHYFECDACLHELEAASEVRELLLARSGARTDGERDIARRAGMPRWLPIAAAVLAAAGAAVWMQGRSSTTRPPDGVVAPAGPRAQPPSAGVVIPKELLAVEAPPYVPIVVRDAAPRPAWDAAMERYARHDYSGAEPLLRQVHRDAPTPAADFYLAICELLTSRDAEAAALLAHVADGGDPVYAGPALLYLGKARLRLGRVAEARDALRRLAASGGPGSEAAGVILQRLAAN